MTTPASTYIAFDFGTKNIGIAVGQSVTRTATELPTIKAKEGIPDWSEIESLIKQWQPKTVIVGLPLNMDGSEQELTRRARKFGNRIHGRFAVPVEFMDERLSTREAKEEAYQQGHQGHYKASPVDSIAARIILESWWSSNG